MGGEQISNGLIVALGCHRCECLDELSVESAQPDALVDELLTLRQILLQLQVGAM